jgi:hypothetical protein
LVDFVTNRFITGTLVALVLFELVQKWIGQDSNQTCPGHILENVFIWGLSYGTGHESEDRTSG